MRLFHFNGASLFFVVMYLHLFKALFYMGYRNAYLWIRGLLMLVLFIAAAFTGYVILWSQMRYWACVVITNLIRVIPYAGFLVLY